MKLAILHYHLNRGGVTQVVANHLRSLAKVPRDKRLVQEVKIFYGGRHAGWPTDIGEQLGDLEMSLVKLPTLEYDDESPKDVDLKNSLLEALAREGCSPNETILHVHNHSLGKNVAFPSALWSLARQGYRLLLQIHDFAEDSRPHNYQRLVAALSPGSPETLGRRLYPQAPHIHYATLNGRDYSLLTAAGVSEQRLHLLPNPVSPFGDSGDRQRARKRLADEFEIPNDQRFVIYPVRPIRRKNLGELLLWASVSRKTSYGVTLVPMNEVERRPFQRWQSLIADLKLPVATGLGEKGGLPFLDNLAAADALITTSVAEGFGMVFLESWLTGCPLLGRDLPEITADFREAGIDLNLLTPRVAIPTSWIGDLPQFRDLFVQSLNELLGAYGRPTLDESLAESEFDSLIEDSTIDFAMLDAQRQADIIRLTWSDSHLQDQLRALNPAIAAADDVDRQSMPELIASNAEQVRKNYSFEPASQKLLTLYQHLANCPIGDIGELDRGPSILDLLLQPHRIHLVRIET